MAQYAAVSAPEGSAMPQPVLVVTDVQDRLFGAMDAERRDEMVRNLKILLATARRLGTPVVVTEQYPKGLGHTLPELRVLLDDASALEKTAFSACGAAGFAERLRELDAAPVILTGVEAHVCVLLTALDLVGRGVRVSIAADAGRRLRTLVDGKSQVRHSTPLAAHVPTWLRDEEAALPAVCRSAARGRLRRSLTDHRYPRWPGYRLHRDVTRRSRPSW